MSTFDYVLYKMMEWLGFDPDSYIDPENGVLTTNLDLSMESDDNRV